MDPVNDIHSRIKFWDRLLKTVIVVTVLYTAYNLVYNRGFKAGIAWTIEYISQPEPEKSKES